MSAFLVPEQFSKLKGGEGEAGEGAMLPWSKGEGPAQGHGVHCGSCWGGGGGEEPRLTSPFAKQQLPVAPFLIAST